MGAVVDLADDLLTGDYEAQEKIIMYGPAGKEEKISMFWRPDVGTGSWVSEGRPEIIMRTSWVMSLDVIPASGTAWGYQTFPMSPATSQAPELGNSIEGASGYGWDSIAIRHADAAFAAGLTLQEKMWVVAWTWEPTDDYDLATVLYPMNIGDNISNVILPDSYLGIQVNPLPGQRRWQVPAWANSGVQSSTKENLAPHVYVRRNVHTNAPNPLEFLYCEWRWIFEP